MCTPHISWRWKGEEMYVTSMTSSRTEEAWPISVGSLPLSPTSPWWLFPVVAFIPSSRFCLLSLIPTALAPHSSHLQKDAPGSWLLPRLPSASHSAVSLHHHLSLNCFPRTSENNSSLESDQRPSEQLNVIAQNYTVLNPGTLLCLSLRKPKAYIYWPGSWGHHGSPQREEGRTPGYSVLEPKSLLL